jgi:hypothetical protein
MLARVSSLETFRQWREDEESTPEQLVARLTAFQPSEAMEAGTAFHKALETAPAGEYAVLAANGFTFHLPDDCELALPAIRELRHAKQYGPLMVSGCVDCLFGNRIEDHKTTSRFDPDRYLAGYQWRFYLDLFGADVFRWNVFEVLDQGNRVYRVRPPQFIEQYRYPGMTDDCSRLAADFYEFGQRYFPTLNQLPEAA